PINAIGVQKSLFESNLLFPGSYKLIAKKGTKLGKLNVSKNIMIDYYQLIKATGVKSDLNFGRLEVNLKPTKAKVKIDNYDIPYNSGMQLPVGDYRISISEAGYNASTKKVSISKNKITKINVSLKALSSKPKAKPLVLVSKLPIVVAKPQNERKEKPIKIQDKVHVNDSVERITVVGRLVPRDILFHFELNNKLRDRVTLVIDNEQIEPIKIRKKTRNKTFVLEAEILPGKYRAKLYTKKHGDFDLGEVEIKNQSINNLNYFLTLH
ncbi:PEGA domain-containing protein, partial [Colwellia sp. BRX8-2]